MVGQKSGGSAPIVGERYNYGGVYITFTGYAKGKPQARVGVPLQEAKTLKDWDAKWGNPLS